MPNEPQELFLVLTCAECGVESEGSARDWRALLTGDEDEADCVDVFC